MSAGLSPPGLKVGPSRFFIIRVEMDNGQPKASVLPRPVLKLDRSADGVVLSWDGDAKLEAGPSAASGFTNVPTAKSPFVVMNGGEQSVFFRLRR